MSDSAEATTEDVGDRALQAIRRIIRRVAVHSKQLSRDTGLTLPQLLCMRAIGRSEDDEVTVAAIADAVHLSRSTVSGIIERLVQADLVRRERSRTDRRRVDLALTASGRAALAETPKPLQERFTSRLAQLPEDEQQQLLHALERIVQLMDAQDLDAAPILVPGTEIRQKGSSAGGA